MSAVAIFQDPSLVHLAQYSFGSTDVLFLQTSISQLLVFFFPVHFFVGTEPTQGKTYQGQKEKGTASNNPKP